MLRLFLDNLWRWKFNLPETDYRSLLPIEPLPSFESLQQTEWSIEFEVYMRNRLIMGAIRYGLIGAAGKPQYDRIASMVKRLHNYTATGNKEHLVDVANLCLLEFVECNHPHQHFHSIDEHTDHVHKR
jgi:hypothetical protein